MIIQMKLLMNFLSHFFQDTKLVYKYQCEGVILFSIQFNFSYIDFPARLDEKTTTINSKNESDMSFWCAASVALNHEEIKRDPQRIEKN